MGEHRHNQLAVPRTFPTRTILGTRRVAILPVKAKDGPDQRGAEVENHGEEGVDHHKAVKGESQGRRPPRDGQDDDHHSDGEAQAVDHHAVMVGGVEVAFAVVGQCPEDNASHERLDHLEEARHGGHVTHHGPRLGPREEHLGAVGEAAHAGADGDGNAVRLHLAALLGTLGLQEVDRVNHGGSDVHERGQHGEGHREVVPRDGHAAVQPRDVQSEDHQRDGEAEAPHEHAKDAVVGAVARAVGHQSHDGAAEEQLAHPGNAEGRQHSLLAEVMLSVGIHVCVGSSLFPPEQLFPLREFCSSVPSSGVLAACSFRCRPHPFLGCLFIGGP